MRRSWQACSVTILAHLWAIGGNTITSDPCTSSSKSPAPLLRSSSSARARGIVRMVGGVKANSSCSAIDRSRQQLLFAWKLATLWRRRVSRSGKLACVKSGALPWTSTRFISHFNRAAPSLDIESTACATHRRVMASLEFGTSWKVS